MFKIQILILKCRGVSCLLRNSLTLEFKQNEHGECKALFAELRNITVLASPVYESSFIKQFISALYV